MKRWIFNILLFSFIFGSTLQAFEKKYDIQFSFIGEGRKWNKINSVDDPLFELNEYYLDGQTVDSWTELVTTQYFLSKVEFKLTDFFNNFLKELAKHNQQNKIDSRIIFEGENELVAEWWIEDRGTNNQYELLRIFKENKSVGTLRYTTKQLNGPKRRVWERILNQAVFRPYKPS